MKDVSIDSDLFRVGRALALEGESRRLAASFDEASIPVLFLTGPNLQRRLFGEPAHYPCFYLDLAVEPEHLATAREAIRSNGWDQVRAPSHETFSKDGFCLHLISGLGPAQKLLDALWDGATAGAEGMLVPRLEPLLVFLGAELAAHDVERPHVDQDLAAAWRQDVDADEVWRIARRSRSLDALRDATERSGSLPAIPTIPWGTRASSRILNVRPISFVPGQARARLEQSLELRREGFGFRANRRGAKEIVAGDLRIEVLEGAFIPWDLGVEALADGCLAMTSDRANPIVVDVGTGSGAVAFLVATARPDARVFALDISYRSVASVRRAKRQLGLDNVTVRQGSLLEPLPPAVRGAVDVVAGNLPYIRPDALGERFDAWPTASLVGYGEHSLGLIKEVAAAASTTLRHRGALLVQCMEWQWRLLAPTLERCGFSEIGATPVGEVREGSNPVVIGRCRLTSTSSS